MTYREITLSKGQTSIVDVGDYEMLSAYKWHAVWEPLTRTFYAEAWLYSPIKRRETMHRILMGCNKRDGMQVDHINGDTLDNRRSNLRFVNHSQNQMNRRLDSDSSSGMRGVSLCKQTGRWKARARANGKEFWVGRFSTKEEAQRAVHVVRLELYGQFARAL